MPAGRIIAIDGKASTDTENDGLDFYWTFEEENFQGGILELELESGEHEFQLKVVDIRGGEETETFTLNVENVPILSLQYSQINLSLIHI